MSGDAYLRLTRQGPMEYGVPEGEGSLLFIDLEPDVSLNVLRQASWAMFRDVEVVVVRASAPALLEDLTTILYDGRSPPRLAALKQTPGELPVLAGEDQVDDEYLDRARAIELRALLEWGNGVWRPVDYHYRLPSGEHAEAFVRLADAFRGPRDAEVLATWLFPHARDGLGIVADTGTLTPLVLALHGAMRSHGMEPGRSEVLDSYQITGHRLRHAIQEVAKRGAVLALLSVNSSGHLLDQMEEAMGSLNSDAERFIDVLISKQKNEEAHSRQGATSIEIWDPLPGRPPIIAYGDVNVDTCRWCTDPERSRIVPISPRSFDGTFEAAIRRLMPSVEDTHENRALWEVCDGGENGAIQLEADPDQEVQAQRPIGKMPIKLDLGTLVADPEFRARAVEALKVRLAGREVRLEPDLVLITRREFELDGATELLDELRSVFGEQVRYLPFPADGEWPAELKTAIADAESICILAFGAVTGISLSTALVAAQQVRKRGGKPITAAVLHARLDRQRAWQTLENQFGNRLYPGFHSYISSRSPLQDELRLLRDLPAEVKLEESVEQFHRARIEHCQNPGQFPEEGVFWGCSPEERLSPNSLFGERIRAKVVYAAVGSSMERTRQEAKARAAPEQRVFDISAIVRSYYDPLILCAIFRWLRPHEQWWGTLPASGETSIVEMVERLRDPAPLGFLIPELLLAAALGKVASGPMAAVYGFAHKLRDEGGLSGTQRAALELGLLLAPEHVSAHEKRARAA